MNRLDELFARKKENVINIYVTAGYPKLESTLPILAALEEAGADMVEIGMPYSDPLADGPVIQESSTIALRNGMSMETLFNQLQELRPAITLPVVLMGYLNPVLQFGFERFCAAAEDVGIDGIILPDLPAYEFATQYQAILEKHNLHFIFLVTPETPEDRIRQLDALSSGFLYAVSSSSTTGGHQDFEAVGKYLERLKSMQLNNPVLAGFGIRDRSSFDAVAQHTNGGIIGTAFIRHLNNADDAVEATKSFLAKF